ncbi:MAG: ferredoxin--NADP reductase [Betaproteobacteria bacterium]|nr:ferredoxin--NADP reductase [Betaproteobacteria bacterium]
MSQPDKFTTEKITEIHAWTPHLFSFKTTRYRGFRFIPGQFARLGLPGDDGKIIWRAYSIVSASYDEYLEFFSIVVPGGAFTSRLSQLREGDEIHVEKMNYGFLTTDRFAGGRDLWMLSTGTGVAPFVSILFEASTWEEYERIVLVHSVRQAAELAYGDTVASLREHEYFGHLSEKLVYVPVVTREAHDGALAHRIPTLLDNGELEARVGFGLDPERSRIMICGNPEMVEETRGWFTGRGYQVSRRGQPGHLALENLW